MARSPTRALLAALILIAAAVPLSAAPSAGAPAGAAAQDAAPSAEALIAAAERLMYPDVKGEASLFFKDSEGRSETYRMVYYAKGRNQKIIVRMLAPAQAKGNDLLMIEKSVWALDGASGRVMKVASNQSFGGTGFSYGDIVRLNFTDNYAPSLKGETAGEWILDLAAKDRGAPYARVELTIAKEGGWPVKGICYARNGSVVKEMSYSSVKDPGTGRKPLAITVVSPLDPGAVNALTILKEEAMSLPDMLFNKRNLEARMEEKK